MVERLGSGELPEVVVGVAVSIVKGRKFGHERLLCVVITPDCLECIHRVDIDLLRLLGLIHETTSKELLKTVCGPRIDD